MAKSSAITSRQVNKANANKTSAVTKKEREILARKSANKTTVDDALNNAGLSFEQVTTELSTVIVTGIKDYKSNGNASLLWYALQKAANSKYGLRLFDMLRKAALVASGAGTKATAPVYNEKTAILRIACKEHETLRQNEQGIDYMEKTHEVKVALAKDTTRSDLGKAFATFEKETKGIENIVLWADTTFTQKPKATPQNKEEKKSSQKALDYIKKLFDAENSKAEQDMLQAMLDGYKKHINAKKDKNVTIHTKAALIPEQNKNEKEKSA